MNGIDTKPIPPKRRRMAYVFRKRNLGTVDIPDSDIGDGYCAADIAL